MRIARFARSTGDVSFGVVEGPGEVARLRGVEVSDLTYRRGGHGVGNGRSDAAMERSPAEAIERLEAADFDLAILDLNYTRDTTSGQEGYDLMERIRAIGDVTLDGRTLHARADDGGAAIPAVLAALDSHGVKAASVTLARPSLDDVYLRHAGRAFDREEVAA